MTVNLTKPRPDIVYIRRRLKVGETPPIATSAVSVPSLKLNSQDTPVEPVSYEPPLLTSDAVLSASEPVYRLSKLASGIGSLVFSGASYVAWETVDGATGYLYAENSHIKNLTVELLNGETRQALPEISTGQTKNRRYITFHKGFLVVGLRSLKHIKRFIIAPLPGEDVQGATGSGIHITLLNNGTDVMYCSNVDSHVEFRLERYRANLYETFNIGTYSIPTPPQATDLRSLFSGERR